jgi:hypothetical protein
MLIRLPLVVGSTALAFALSVAPANAGSTRLGTLSLTCDGTLRHESFNAGGFPASTDQFILGGEVTVVDRKSKLDYLLVRAGDLQFLSLGGKATHEAFALPTFIKVTSDASGNVLITLDALCRKGPEITAFVNVIFN